MKKPNLIRSVWITTILALSTSVLAAGKSATVSLSPGGKKLEAHYSKMLADLKEEIVSLVPKGDEKVKGDFNKQLDALRNVPPITKNVKDRRTKVEREVTLKCDPGNPAFVENRRRYFWRPGLF